MHKFADFLSVPFMRSEAIAAVLSDSSTLNADAAYSPHTFVTAHERTNVTRSFKISLYSLEIHRHIIQLLERVPVRRPGYGTFLCQYHSIAEVLKKMDT
jgi:hypothetical protein